MNLTDLSKSIHAANIKWWQDPATQQPISRNRGELLALIHSEISEHSEGELEEAMDDKLPHRMMDEVEMADALIRVLDYAAGFDHPIGEQALLYGVSEFVDLNHLSQCWSSDVAGDIMGRMSQLGAVVAIHCQISRVLENERKGKSKDACEQLVMLIAYITIYSRKQMFDLQAACDEKMAYNAQREDHKHEARLIAGGKQF